MNFDLENELRPNLHKDEKILWTGRPKTGIVFRSSDALVIPFSIVWIVVVVSMWYSSFRFGTIFSEFLGIPFIIAGLYLAVGRFFVDAIKRKNTVYAVTDNRVIIKSGILDKEIQSLHIRTLSDMTFKEKSDGSGTITFGRNEQRYTPFYGNNMPGAKLAPCFELIDEVGKVYSLLIQQQRKYETI